MDHGPYINQNLAKTTFIYLNFLSIHGLPIPSHQTQYHERVEWINSTNN